VNHTQKSILIRLQQLYKVYREAGEDRVILNELNREFYEGEFVCLLGRSGSGKSTLLNLISGIDAPSSGDVLIRDGQQEVTLTHLSEHQRTLFRRRHIGIVFQFFNLIPTLTVQENVTLPLELANSRGDLNKKAATLLAQVGLGDRIATYPDKLSGGEQQRVAIANRRIYPKNFVDTDSGRGKNSFYGNPCARDRRTGRPSPLS